MKTLLLWGDTMAGKSTLLASAFGGLPALPGVTVGKGAAGSAIHEFTRQWLALTEGNVLPRTNTDRLDYSVTMTAQPPLRLRDIRGSDVAAEAECLIAEADGVLVVINHETDEKMLQQQVNALMHAAPALRGKPGWVAVTKLDRELKSTDRRWRRNGEWHDWVGTHYGALLGVIDLQCWWPVSALGFDRHGSPACALGEFGEILPRGVWAPTNVKDLFRDILGVLGYGS